jgi:HDOD domain
MLNALLSRWRAKPPTPPPVRRLAVPTSAPAAGAPMAGIGARRPLVSATGRLAGFEFQLGDAAAHRLRAGADSAVAVAYTGNLLGAMRLCASRDMAALAALPAGWLARAAADRDLVPGMHLLLQPDALFADADAVCALITRLRRAGVRAGWDPLAEPRMPGAAGRPDFMPLRAPPTNDADAWQQALAAAARRWPGVPLLLLDLPGVDVLETVLGPPLLWAACSLGPCAEPQRVQALPPQAQHALRLLNRLLHDDDHGAVVADIKADAALSLRLLSYLNSAGASPGRELDSIEQAVMLLGRDALYRWVAQMLVRLAPPRPAAHALQASALARARLFELLARAASAPSPGAAYLLGLATMLPLLLQCGVDEAAGALNLPPAAVQALRGQGGPWLPYLGLLQALEAGDMAAVETAATPFGGQAAVLACWTEAWRG